MEKVRAKLFGSDYDPYVNFIPIEFDGGGWSSEHESFGLYINQFRPKLIVEVGTWFGGSSRTMTKACLDAGIEDFEIVCIDTFLGSFEHWDRTSATMKFINGRPNNYEQFISNTIHYKYQPYITPFPVDSINGYHVLKNLGITPDMVYIDAGHDYASALADYRNYAEILKPAGVLIGDDWHHQPIKDAAKDTFREGTVIDHGAKFAWIK